MGIQKNVNSQKIAVFAFNELTGVGETGDAANITAEISKDFGASVATNDANPAELESTDHPGMYVFELLQAETNADVIVISAVSSTANIIIDPIQVFTVPPNFSSLGIESDGDITKVNSLHGHTAQTADNNTILAHADYGNSALKARGDSTWATATSVTTTGGTVTTLTNLPPAPADWLDAASVKAETVTKIQSGLATTGADSDTLKTLSDQLDGVTGALNGDGAYTGTLTVEDGDGTGLESATVHASLGGVLKASGTTGSSGTITDWVFGAATYTLAVRLAGYQPETDTVVVSGDAWTKTIVMTAISISSPDSVSLCTVSFQVKLSDTEVAGAVCKAKLLGINQASDGVILSNAESSATTDALGVAELQLVRKDSIVKGQGLYKIWVEIAGNPVASVETTIPSQSTVLFEDMIQ